MAAQLGLFGTEYVIGSTKEPSIGWSFSRRSLFEQCLLWYYYRYYGASAKTAKTEPLKEQLRFLTKLVGIDLRVGKILHFIIETYLKRLQQGNSLTPQEAVRWASNIFQKDLNLSIAWQRDRRLPEQDDYAVLLLEFYYEHADARARWGTAAARLQKALNTFFRGPEIAPFREGALHDGALIERKVKLTDGDFCMTGKIDLAYPHDGRIKVVDWKIRNSGGDDNRLQLISYALPILNKFDCSPDSIDLFKVHLDDGSITKFSVSQEEAQRGRMRIIQDTIRMKSVDQYGREAVGEAFTPCQHRLICRMCPFQSLCPKE